MRTDDRMCIEVPKFASVQGVVNPVVAVDSNGDATYRCAAEVARCVAATGLVLRSLEYKILARDIAPV
jgi:hypothetical protein